MPRKPIDYSKTYFYKIVCKDTSITDCYVGHTTDFTKRKYTHKHSCQNNMNKGFNNLVYDFIRKNGQWDNWEMILIDVENCENSLVAHQRERFYKEQLNATLNKNIPARTKQEYRQDHKDKNNQYSREYWKNNNERLLNYKKHYRENKKDIIAERAKSKIICNCGSVCRKAGISRHINTQKHLNYVSSLKCED